jgi:DNA-binding CsgD family transcriptional regulator
VWSDFSGNKGYEQALHQAKAHGLCHGITLVYYTEDRLNMYYAGTSQTLLNDQVLLNIKDQLAHFIPYFHYEAKALISESAKHTFAVRKDNKIDGHQMDSDQLKLFYDAIPVKQLVINEQGDYLTHQQALCVYLSIKGNSAKQISEQLRISIRTVEKHMFNVRKKLKIQIHESLLKTIFESQYFNHIMIYGERYS